MNKRLLTSYLQNLLFCLLLLTIVSFSCGVHAQSKKLPDINQQAKPHRIIYGLASFYADKFNGRKTSSGEIFRQNKFTCACNMLPLGTWLRITNVKNGRSVIVKVNDRLHPKMRRIADLSKIAASQLRYTSSGITRVKVEVLGKVKPK